MTRVAFVGDVHGYSDFLFFAVDRALEQEADLIVQLGDLGFWWPGMAGAAFMDDVAFCAKRIPIWWVPGNHENYDALEELGAVSGDEPQELMPGFFHLPRSCVFDLDGKRFMAIGGASSIDKKYRVEHESWWWQESIGEADVARCIDRGKVDIVLSHDCPSWVQIPGAHAANKADHKPSWFNRSCLQRVLEECQPSLWFHGHHHIRYDYQGDIALVRGLASNFDATDAVLVVDLAEGIPNYQAGGE